MTEAEIMPLLVEMVVAVHEVHTRDVLHRKLFPSHVMIDSKNHIKVIGFSGLRELLHEGSIGSIKEEDKEGNSYAAFETKTGGLGATKPTDVWTLGMMLFEMANGSSAFKGMDDNDDKCMAFINSGEFLAAKGIADKSEKFKQVLKGCLTVNTGDRHTIVSILEALKEEVKAYLHSADFEDRYTESCAMRQVMVEDLALMRYMTTDD